MHALRSHITCIYRYDNFLRRYMQGNLANDRIVGGRNQRYGGTRQACRHVLYWTVPAGRNSKSMEVEREHFVCIHGLAFFFSFFLSFQINYNIHRSSHLHHAPIFSMHGNKYSIRPFSHPDHLLK